MGLLASALILDPAEAATAPSPISAGNPVLPATAARGPLAPRKAAELTAGHTVFARIKAMVAGWEEN
jgi:hypothetical protein